MSNFPQCIRSGFCCQQAPCEFGEATSLVDNSCRFLGGEKAGEYFCMKYEEIKLGSDGLSLSTLHAVTGRATTPQVYIEGVHIGGADELVEWIKNK